VLARARYGGARQRIGELLRKAVGADYDTWTVRSLVDTLSAYLFGEVSTLRRYARNILTYRVQQASDGALD
jgi:hypothetical protein